MIVKQAASTTEILTPANSFDYKAIFGLPWLDDQAREVTKGLDSYCHNILEISLEQSDKLCAFQNECKVHLGEQEGRKAFKAWLKSLGVTEYIAKGVMRLGRWFNSLQKGMQDLIRENTHGWKLSFLKKLMKFPLEEIVDLVVEDRLKQAVIGGVKEKRRELRIDGYAKVITEAHELQNKVGRLAHQYENGDWLLEITDLENPISTEFRFRAEDLSPSNKPRFASQNLDRFEEKHHTVLPDLEEQKGDLKNLEHHKTNTTFTVNSDASTDNLSQGHLSTFEELTPSTFVDFHTQAKNLDQELHLQDQKTRSTQSLQLEVSQVEIQQTQTEESEKNSEVVRLEDLAQIIAQVKAEAEKAAFIKAQNLFEQKLKEKELEVNELRSQRSSSTGGLIFTQEQLDEMIKDAVTKEKEERIAEILAKQRLKQELEETKQELQNARMLQSENQQLRQQIEELKMIKPQLELKAIEAEKEAFRLENQELHQQIKNFKKGFAKPLETSNSKNTQKQFSIADYSEQVGETQSALDESDHKLEMEFTKLETQIGIDEIKEVAAIAVAVAPAFESFEMPGWEGGGYRGSDGKFYTGWKALEVFIKDIKESVAPSTHIQPLHEFSAV